MLKQLLGLLVLVLFVNTSTIKNEQNSLSNIGSFIITLQILFFKNDFFLIEQQIICEQKLGNKCITNERFQRSIQEPISSFFKRLFGQDKETNDFTVIRCDKGLVIKVVDSVVSNVDKSQCSTTKGQGKTDDCTNKLLTTILLSKK